MNEWDAWVKRTPARAEVYLGLVTKKDFRRNERGELGTRTATLHRAGLAHFRKSWLYKLKR